MSALLVPLTAACIAAAASAFGLPEPALWTILKTEAGRVGACVTQANGTHDCGPAQVNAETWAPALGRLLHRPAGEVAESLRDDGCFNVSAAAYVLRTKLREADGDIWDAAGRYNSATPEVKRIYQRHLIASYQKLFAGPMR